MEQGKFIHIQDLKNLTKAVATGVVLVLLGTSCIDAKQNLVPSPVSGGIPTPTLADVRGGEINSAFNSTPEMQRLKGDVKSVLPIKDAGLENVETGAVVEAIGSPDSFRVSGPVLFLHTSSNEETKQLLTILDNAAGIARESLKQHLTYQFYQNRLENLPKDPLILAPDRSAQEKFLKSKLEELKQEGHDLPVGFETVVVDKVAVLAPEDVHRAATEQPFCWDKPWQYNYPHEENPGAQYSDDYYSDVTFDTKDWLMVGINENGKRYFIVNKSGWPRTWPDDTNKYLDNIQPLPEDRLEELGVWTSQVLKIDASQTPEMVMVPDATCALVK